MGWIDLVQDKDRWQDLVNSVMNLRVPSNAGNFLTSWEAVTLWRRSLFNSAQRLEDTAITGKVDNCLPNDTT